MATPTDTRLKELRERVSERYYHGIKTCGLLDRLESILGWILMGLGALLGLVIIPAFEEEAGAAGLVGGLLVTGAMIGSAYLMSMFARALIQIGRAQIDTAVNTAVLTELTSERAGPAGTAPPEKEHRPEPVLN